MKLRSFLILFSSILIALIMIFIVGQTRSTLNDGFNDLQAQQRENIAHLVTSALETSKQQLDSYGRILRADNDLAGAYLLATENGDRQLIEEKLSNIKKNVQFDIVDIISPHHLPILHDNMAIDRDKIQSLLDTRSHSILVQPEGEHLQMLALWTIDLYDKPVGVLVLGTYLDEVADAQVAKVTNSKITLRGYQTPTSSVASNEIALGFSGAKILASIEPLTDPGSVVASAMSFRLGWIGIASILVLAFLFYIFLEIGFIRHFMDIVSAIDGYTNALTQGRLEPLNLKKGKIAEINLLAESFEKLTSSLHGYRDEVVKITASEAELKRQKTLSAMARQVAHDIRSPLSALGVLLTRTDQLPEDHRVLARSAITRITDIANNLLAQNLSSENKTKPEKSKQLISSLLENVLSEKRIRFKNLLNIEINYHPTPSSYGLFASVHSVEFKRVISNLIDNAVEAMVGDAGVVSISLSSSDKDVLIVIEDNGKGIPEHLIPQLGQLGFSFGKSNGESGSGLGLHHAKKVIQEWGGSLAIESIVDKGTKVKICLPRVESPNWFAKRLNISPETAVIVVDDDPSIHRIWNSRLTDAKLGNEVLHFSQPHEFRSWLESNSMDLQKSFFLIDFEFVGSGLNGLDLIETSEIAESSILVTSHYEEPDILARVSELGVQMLPKDAAGLIPIVTS